MRPPKSLTLLCAALVGASFAAACGEEEGEPVREGEKLEVGELTYNVAITRFLNPDDVEDREYLEGAPELSAGSDYLGVFVTVENESEDEELGLADTYTITDTRDEEYEPVSLDNPYGLDFDATVVPEGEIPIPDSTAAAGPIKGAMLLYEVPAIATENRPFILEIVNAEGEGGEVQLDL